MDELANCFARAKLYLSGLFAEQHEGIHVTENQEIVS